MTEAKNKKNLKNPSIGESKDSSGGERVMFIQNVLFVWGHFYRFKEVPVVKRPLYAALTTKMQSQAILMLMRITCQYNPAAVTVPTY